MTKLVIMRGLPASGKSTWAKDWVAEDVHTRVRINRDDLRGMVHNGEYQGHLTESKILKARDVLIASFLRQGVDVVCDDTNLPSRTVRDLMKVAAGVSPLIEVVIEDLSSVLPEVCILRDEKRERTVGADVIMGMYDRYIGNGLSVPELAPKTTQEVEPYVAKPGTPKAVLVDLDGTVALLNDRSPYDETRVSQDEPNPRIIELVHLLAFAGNYLVFMSGRTAGCMHDTMTWLDAQGFEDYHLYMRNVSDTRKDAVVKLELFNTNIRDYFDVQLAIDDRDQVVELWRSLGLTCLQVAPGDF